MSFIVNSPECFGLKQGEPGYDEFLADGPAENCDNSSGVDFDAPLPVFPENCVSYRPLTPGEQRVVDAGVRLIITKSAVGGKQVY